MLRIEGVDAVYGPVKALSGVTMDIAKGELVGLLGANNAGKSSVMNVLSGIVPAAAGRVTFEGEDITRMPPKRRVEMGIVQVPEGRDAQGGQARLRGPEQAHIEQVGRA